MPATKLLRFLFISDDVLVEMQAAAIALFFVVLEDLVLFLFLVSVLVIWGQLPRIWMYMLCIVIFE
jgi:hypothetical protein